MNCTVVCILPHWNWIVRTLLSTQTQYVSGCIVSLPTIAVSFTHLVSKCTLSGVCDGFVRSVALTTHADFAVMSLTLQLWNFAKKWITNELQLTSLEESIFQLSAAGSYHFHGFEEKKNAIVNYFYAWNTNLAQINFPCCSAWFICNKSH